MSNYKKLSWTDSDVLCPFYQECTTKGEVISCEGFVSGMSIRMHFKKRSDKDRHMGIYCANRYKECPMYKCTLAYKYKNED